MSRVALANLKMAISASPRFLCGCGAAVRSGCVEADFIAPKCSIEPGGLRPSHTIARGILPDPRRTPASRFLLRPWCWWAVIVVAGVADTWGGRYDLNPDGISYIEMARHA